MADHPPAAGRWFVRWCLLMALWLALTDTRNTQDLVAGAVAALIAATAAGLVTRRGSPKPVMKSLGLLRIGPRRLARPLVRLVVDTGVLSRALATPPTGQGVRAPIPAARDPPHAPRRPAAGRGVTAAWGRSAHDRSG